MVEETEVGCSRPASGPVEEAQQEERQTTESVKEERSMIMVGQEAPDFSAPGYQQGKFINVKLSDFRGKWVVLCFYPGDFTFV